MSRTISLRRAGSGPTPGTMLARASLGPRLQPAALPQRPGPRLVPRASCMSRSSSSARSAGGRAALPRRSRRQCGAGRRREKARAIRAPAARPPCRRPAAERGGVRARGPRPAARHGPDARVGSRGRRALCRLLVARRSRRPVPADRARNARTSSRLATAAHRRAAVDDGGGLVRRAVGPALAGIERSVEVLASRTSARIGGRPHGFRISNVFIAYRWYARDGSLVVDEGPTDAASRRQCRREAASCSPRRHPAVDGGPLHARCRSRPRARPLVRVRAADQRRCRRGADRRRARRSGDLARRRRGRAGAHRARPGSPSSTCCAVISGLDQRRHRVRG